MIQFLKDIYFYSIDNFTLFHIYTLIVSIFVIFMSTILLQLSKKKDANQIQEENVNEHEDSKNGLQAKYKMAKQKLLEKQLLIDRNYGIEEEKKCELETLKIVMGLLKEHSGNEKILTMNELQEQLDLYRT